METIKTALLENCSGLNDIERRGRIIELAREAKSGAEEVKKRMRLSIDQALECGRLLIEEKHYNAGKGQWRRYFDAYYGSEMSYSAAASWMQLAVKHGQSLDLPDSNRMRNGMLALKLFPAKEHMELAANPHVKLSANHLAAVNRFDAWYRGFKQRDDVSKQEVRNLCDDFRDVITFVKWLEKKALSAH